MTEAHYRAAVHLRFGRRIMNRLTGIGDNRVTQNAQLAGVAVDFQFHSRAARRPMIHSRERRLLYHRPHAVVTNGFEHDTTALSAYNLLDRKAGFTPAEPSFE